MDDNCDIATFLILVIGVVFLGILVFVYALMIVFNAVLFFGPGILIYLVLALIYVLCATVHYSKIETVFPSISFKNGSAEERVTVSLSDSFEKSVRVGVLYLFGVIAAIAPLLMIYYVRQENLTAIAHQPPSSVFDENALWIWIVVGIVGVSATSWLTAVVPNMAREMIVRGVKSRLRIEKLSEQATQLLTNEQSIATLLSSEFNTPTDPNGLDRLVAEMKSCVANGESMIQYVRRKVSAQKDKLRSLKTCAQSYKDTTAYLNRIAPDVLASGHQDLRDGVAILFRCLEDDSFIQLPANGQYESFLGLLKQSHSAAESFHTDAKQNRPKAGERRTGGQNHFETALKSMGLTASATWPEIQKKFRKIAHQFHNDHTRELSPELREVIGEQFLRIKEDYEYLRRIGYKQ